MLFFLHQQVAGAGHIYLHHLLRHWQLLLHDGPGQIRSGFVIVVALPRVSHSRAWRNRFRFGVVVAAFAVLEIH
jgi:hypothetical protein